MSKSGTNVNMEELSASAAIKNLFYTYACVFNVKTDYQKKFSIADLAWSAESSTRISHYSRFTWSSIRRSLFFRQIYLL